MKIVIDNAIPFIKGVFEPYAEVVYREGEAICHDDLADADALIIRTRTRCDEDMLSGSAVKMIATTSIGVNNIDIPFCERNHIKVENASGSVSGAVMNYVLSSLYASASRRSRSLKDAVFGILGVGHTGSRVAWAAQKLGFKTMLYDPPRSKIESQETFWELDELLPQCDIVTLHLPVNENTFHMADASFFAKMKQGAIFINTAKGDLVNEDDLIEASRKLGPIIIDAWSHEPDINLHLMSVADIATPHISGYSYQGKMLSTRLAVRAIARHFGIDGLANFFPVGEVEVRDPVRLDLSGKTQGEITALIQYTYPIFTDDFIFRTNPERFVELRGRYSYRREFVLE